MPVLTVKWLARMMRHIPCVRGMPFLARRVLWPLVYGQHYESLVHLKNNPNCKLICNLDSFLPWFVFLFGQYVYERRCEPLLLALAQQCSVVFDVGANIGYYTVQLGRAAKHVHAFEPVSYQFGILEENLGINGLGNVCANRTIVSDTIGTKRIFFPGVRDAGCSSLEQQAPVWEDVECVTLDSYCDARGIDVVDLVKIDVEGHELAVLKGMQRLLANNRVKWCFCEINRHTLASAGVQIKDVLDFLGRYHYRPYAIRGLTIRPYDGLADESLVLFRRAHGKGTGTSR